MKVFTIDALTSNSMKSSNPHSGIHETHVAKCLDTACLDPSCNQGGHMVCYRKTAHPRNPHEGQGYEETHIADTLNVFDNGESRTPIIVLEGHGSRPSHMGNGYSESDTMYTLNTIEQHSVCYPRCYQKTVGALCADDWRMINKQYVDQNKVVCYAVDCRNNCLIQEMSSTLQAKPQGGWSVNVTNPILITNGDEEH